MEHLWAPWRMAYIERPKEEGCIFCTKPARGQDREELVLWRGRLCFVLMNLFPYNNGHVMVAPYRHTGDLAALTADEQAELMGLTRFCLRALRETYRPDGFNLGMNLGRCAGAGVVDHLHLHVVPRWDGDTNFMPVTAGTKVLPDALFDSYDRLRAAMERLAAAESG